MTGDAVGGGRDHVIGVLGDVHANARALRAALDRVRRRPLDGLVFLGDLLTYGGDVGEVLDLVEAEVARGAVVLLGNHDQLYRDLAVGERAYYDGLPEWIRESVDYTVDALGSDVQRLARIPFRPTYTVGPVFFAHANASEPRPDGTPDWRYVAKAEDFAHAATQLARKGAWAGVFGHTHRTRIVEWPSGRGLGDDGRLDVAAWRPVGPSEPDPQRLVVTAGAVGQPRNPAARCTVAWVTLRGGRAAPGGVDVSIAPLAWDVAGHLDALASLPLSPPTRAQLAAFFRPMAPPPR